MHTITYEPDDKAIHLEEGETILDASLRDGIPHVHACGGNGKCSTCRVLILRGIEHLPPRNDAEKVLSEKLGFSSVIRLACQTMPAGNVTVRRAVLDDIDKELIKQQFTRTEESQVGTLKQVTLLFADIAGYTRFAETWQPYDVVHVLSRYYYLMGNVIRDHGGYIMDYYGDGFLAVFDEGEPENHALWAVRAGKQMFKALERFNDYLARFLGQEFAIRIGIHTGEVIAGSIGITGMRKDAVIGDAVNFASRIESANKQLGTHFLVSEATYQAVQTRFQIKQQYAIEVKGKTGQHQVFELG